MHSPLVRAVGFVEADGEVQAERHAVRGAEPRAERRTVLHDGAVDPREFLSNLEKVFGLNHNSRLTIFLAAGNK